MLSALGLRGVYTYLVVSASMSASSFLANHPGVKVVGGITVLTMAIAVVIIAAYRYGLVDEVLEDSERDTEADPTPATLQQPAGSQCTTSSGAQGLTDTNGTCIPITDTDPGSDPGADPKPDPEPGGAGSQECPPNDEGYNGPVRLWRAVDGDELDLLERDDEFKVEPNGQEGKNFFPTREQAEAFGRNMGGGPYTLTSADAPASVLDNAYCFEPMGEGLAYFIWEYDVSKLNNIQIYGLIQ